jgi:hypothetical protein
MKASHPLRALLAAAGLAAAVLVTPGCHSPTEPGLDEADVRILFIGNSLTFFNNLPDLVQAIAEVGGVDVSTATRARADYSLEEHWGDGIAARIRSLRPDLVVMQQGPSSLAQNKLHLRAWADSIARVAREVDATPALMMVWPSVDRLFAFDDVLDSYRSAAQATSSAFVPAGEAWREVWAEDPGAALYGLDGFQPSRLGSVVAALTVVHALLGIDPAALPARIEPATPGLPTIVLDPAEATRIQQAVVRAVAAHAGG